MGLEHHITHKKKLFYFFFSKLCASLTRVLFVRFVDKKCTSHVLYTWPCPKWPLSHIPMVTPYPSVPHGQVKIFLGIDMNDKNGKYYKIRRLKGVIMNIVFNGLSYNKMVERLSE